MLHLLPDNFENNGIPSHASFAVKDNSGSNGWNKLIMRSNLRSNCDISRLVII